MCGLGFRVKGLILFRVQDLGLESHGGVVSGLIMGITGD